MRKDRYEATEIRIDLQIPLFLRPDIALSKYHIGLSARIIHLLSTYLIPFVGGHELGCNGTRLRSFLIFRSVTAYSLFHAIHNLFRVLLGSSRIFPPPAAQCKPEYPETREDFAWSSCTLLSRDRYNCEWDYTLTQILFNAFTLLVVSCTFARWIQHRARG